MANAKGASLLTIPAELRNTIYEHVLLRKQRIDLNETSKPPGLLATCRQIRKETIAIYFKGNDFVFKVHEYDGADASHAFKLVRKYRPNDSKAICIELCENCTNVHICKLHKWLKAYHAESKMPFLRQDKCAEETDAQTLARRTFGVVQAMRSKPWEDVEEVLASFYRAIDMFECGESEEDSEDEDEDESEESSDEDDESDSDSAGSSSQYEGDARKANG